MSAENQVVSLESQMLMGYHIVLLHIFSCLNAKEILPFSEAAQSLQETSNLLENQPEKTKATIQLVVQVLNVYASEGIRPDPTRTPPPTRLH